MKEIFTNSDLQWRGLGEKNWKDCLGFSDIEYRFKPKYNLENSEANAKVLVKSRQMLEMLEILLATFRYNDDLEPYEIERLKKAEQLIKEANDL